MPGLAASSLVFENINLKNSKYQLHRLDWIQPKKNESINSYCKRLSKKIKHKEPILLGVSFGGIIVQELDKILNVKKLIIVSSVKTHHEYPVVFKIARDYQLNNALPFGMFDNFVKFSRNKIKISVGKRRPGDPAYTLSNNNKIKRKLKIKFKKSNLKNIISDLVLWKSSLSKKLGQKSKMISIKYKSNL